MDNSITKLNSYGWGVGWGVGGLVQGVGAHWALGPPWRPPPRRWGGPWAQCPPPPMGTTPSQFLHFGLLDLLSRFTSFWFLIPSELEQICQHFIYFGVSAPFELAHFTYLGSQC